MEVSGTIGAVLNDKGDAIWSVTPESMVFDAIQLMADKNIGAVLVMQGQRLVGIMSERDYTRKVILKGRSSRQTPVKDIMTASLITTTPEKSVAECVRLMSDKRIRHLPVIEDNQVIGVISMGNLVKWIIAAQNSTIDQLQNYIAGGYAA